MITEPNFVLLHGLGSSSHLWVHVAENLAGVRPLHPDLPGFGSEQASRARDVAGLADFVASCVHRAGFERFVLVAHDFAAGIAVEVAARGLSGLVGLGLVSPAPLRAELPRDLLDRLMSLPGDEAALRAYYRSAVNRECALEDVETLVRDGVRCDPHEWRAWLTERRDLREEASRVTVPTLILTSDAAFDEGDFSNLKEVTRLHLEGVGAYPALEAPRQVTKHLLHWTRTTLRDVTDGSNAQ
ncbi:alpha/beta fold hydrolase [Deinococcus yavapaiensis]|nr:alpha/beta hydrolase [Deinococcus yavapaiensis]